MAPQQEESAAPDDGELAPGIRLISVKIPDGKNPGDTFVYKDDEQTMEIVVPEDHKPGDVMEILLDDDDDGIEAVSVFLGPHIDVTLNMVTFLDEPDEVTEILYADADEAAAGAEAAKKAAEEDEKAAENEEDDDEDIDGTNFMVWPAGTQMAQFLACPAAKDIIKDKTSALELGSGCGVSGMALAAALARCDNPSEKKVVLTDLPVSMSLLTANFEENEEAIVANSGLDVKTACLSWGNEDDMKALGDDAKFDLIIGSDIIYNPDEEVIQALTTTIDKLLDPENGLVLLATRWRKFNDERAFFHAMEKLGYEFVLARKLHGYSDEDMKKNDEDYHPECPLSWQEFGSDKSEESKKFFAETKFKVAGEEKPLSELSDDSMEQMEDKDFDNYEMTHIQMYAGYKKK